ncbi:MAG: nucleotidyltransferase family protein [Prochlorotrichaceae cyanobacterium]|jgi:predicted nucleotidyltransferase
MSENGNTFDIRAARRYLQQKQETRQAKRLALWQQACQDAQKIIKMVEEKYQPKQIIQWGSILDPKHFSEISDIDLAIVGLDSITFLRLLADAEALTTFPLDLVQWEAIHPAFQNIILMKGKIVYGSE